jgi:Mg2+-importing ATPase
VLVRRLSAIENLGSMDTLCTDKTGTITEGVVHLDGAYDSSGAPSAQVLELAAINASFETGISSPLDDAIVAASRPPLGGVSKLGEIPFDFVRKRATIVVRTPEGGARLVVKGAFHHVLEICTTTDDGTVLDGAACARLERLYERWTSDGIRVLAVATRLLPLQVEYRRQDENGMVFAGFLTFTDQPKPGVDEAIAQLSRLGVSVKVITGDSRLVWFYRSR